MIHRFSQTNDRANNIASRQGQLHMQLSHRSDMEQRHTLIQQHDPDSQDMAYANRVAQEIINISGASVIVYPRMNNEDYDKVWEEDPHPTYGSGHHIKAYFAPQPLATELTPWGVDTPNQTDVVFARQEVYAEFSSRMIRIGDIIELPYNSLAIATPVAKGPDRYRVLNAFDSGNFRYDWLYFTCKVENITDDTTIDIDHK